jgi:hypothetical protein
VVPTGAHGGWLALVTAWLGRVACAAAASPAPATGCGKCILELQIGPILAFSVRTGAAFEPRDLGGFNAGGEMRFLINTIAAVAILMPASLWAQARDGVATCRGNLDGDNLITTIVFENGYAVEAPWRITTKAAIALENGSNGVAMDARLDRIIERDPSTGRQVETPFPDPIRTRFEGPNEEELVTRAAQIWCLTVLKVQEQNPGRLPARGGSARSGSVGLK